MSVQGVTQVIGALVLDPEFRKDFQENPDKALKFFDLTKEEMAKLKEAWDTVPGK